LIPKAFGIRFLLLLKKKHYQANIYAMEPGSIIVNPHIKPDHNDYIVLKNEEEEAVFKQMCRTSPNLVLTIHGLAGFLGRWSKK